MLHTCVKIKLSSNLTMAIFRTERALQRITERGSWALTQVSGVNTKLQCLKTIKQKKFLEVNYHSEVPRTKKVGWRRVGKVREVVPASHAVSGFDLLTASFGQGKKIPDVRLTAFCHETFPIWRCNLTCSKPSAIASCSRAAIKTDVWHLCSMSDRSGALEPGFVQYGAFLSSLRKL